MDAGPRVLWPDDPGALGLHVDPDLFRRMARAAGGLANHPLGRNFWTDVTGD
jgi:hypothetical protein